MSPLLVRRYRAERLLRDEFEALRATVLARVVRRLRARGARLDAGDLEACYSQAWQGLYAAVLEGQQIDDPGAWLTLVSYRRAIDEHRSRGRLSCEPFDAVCEDVIPSGDAATRRQCAASEHDIAARLDDRVRLRQLFEALRGRLSERELQAATLCYLQGLSRAQAAARMGVSESRMRKLMDGGGSHAPGVAAKMGALVQTIGAYGWCEEQGSLMRGLAYGMLDPDGERHRLAMLHRDACPACRAYVLSLRGLAAVLPPAPSLLHLLLGVGAGAGAGAAAGGGSGPAASTAAPTASATSVGAVSASGAGAAGGGWLLAGGPLGAKLAVGCLLALGAGAGCVALTDHPNRPASARHHRHAHLSGPGASAGPAGPYQGAAPPPSFAAGSAGSADAVRRAPAASPSPPSSASREFGPEQAAAPAARPAGSGSPGTLTARAASQTGGAPASGAEARSAGEASTPAARDSSGASAAEREFAPG